MDADGLPIVGRGINLAEVDPISPKRMLAFLNHFIVHTSGFLNRFSVICEEKLEDLSVRLQRLETTVCLLEAKLSSIPGLDDISHAPPAVSATEMPTVVTTTSVNDADKADTTPVTSTLVTSDETPASAEPSANSTAAKDPRYQKFFRLLKMQVPREALQQRMVIEGLDPAVLDNPDADAAPSVDEKPEQQQQQRQHSSDSDVDFSDDDKQSTSSGSDFS